jgi:hypothetical protein
VGSCIIYLTFVGKINQHYFARLLFSASTVQADSSNHVHPTTLDEVIHSSNFEDLNTTGNDMLLDRNGHLRCHGLHQFATFK